MWVRKEQGQRSSQRKVERKPLGAEGHNSGPDEGGEEREAKKTNCIEKEKTKQKSHKES